MGWVHGFGVRRVLGISGAALAVSLSGVLIAAAPASALGPTVARTADAGSGSSTLNGTIVVPGSAGAAGGVTVSLKAAPTSGDSITRSVVSKADGTFTFPDLAGGDWIYTVTVPYEGANFSSDPVTVPAGKSAAVKIPVFSPTEDASKVTTTSWIVWLDETGERLAVEQDLSYNNAGTKAYTGKDPVSGAAAGAKAAVLLPIAADAANYQYLGRFEVCCAVLDATWVHTRPINPGGSSGTLRYDSPRPASLIFTAQFRTDDFTVLVPQGTTITSPQLTAKGTSTDRGVTYNVYKSGALKSGDTVTVTLGGATAAASGPSPWLWVGLGVLALVVVGALVWFLRRRSASKPAAVTAPKGAQATKVTKPKTTPTPRPAKDPKPVAKPAATAAAAPRRTAAEQLAEQLAQLDLKFENGELTDEAAYRRVRESLVQQLVDAVATDPTSLS
jgi:hypothetical protein